MNEAVNKGSIFHTNMNLAHYQVLGDQAQLCNNGFTVS